MCFWTKRMKYLIYLISLVNFSNTIFNYSLACKDLQLCVRVGSIMCEPWKPPSLPLCRNKHPQTDGDALKVKLDSSIVQECTLCKQCWLPVPRQRYCGTWGCWLREGWMVVHRSIHWGKAGTLREWPQSFSILICKGQIITELALLKPETVSLHCEEG